MGLIYYAIPFSLIVWGQTRIESGVASILNATTPIFNVVLAHFLTSDERLAIAKVTGVLVGFIGVYLMMMPGRNDGYSWRDQGQAANLGAASIESFAAYSASDLSTVLQSSIRSACCCAQAFRICRLGMYFSGTDHY